MAQATASTVNAELAASTAPARSVPTAVSAHTSSGSSGMAGAARPQPRRNAPRPITATAPRKRPVSKRTCQAGGARQHSAAATDSAR